MYKKTSILDNTGFKDKNCIYSLPARHGKCYQRKHSPFSAISAFFPLQLGLEFLFRRQHHPALGGKKLSVLLQHAIVNDGFVFFGTKNNSDCWVIICRFYPILKDPDVHIHLSDVLVGQLADLQVDQHKTLEQKIVKDQINKET